MSEVDQLRAEVCAANRALVAHGLVTLTWGNVSGISKDRRLVAIKPSGVPHCLQRAQRANSPAIPNLCGGMIRWMVQAQLVDFFLANPSYRLNHHYTRIAKMYYMRKVYRPLCD